MGFKRDIFLDNIKKINISMPNKIIVDGRGHLLGRLASVIAKKLLSGTSIVVVRCEDILISGGLLRQKMKYERFIQKSHNSNPRRCGPVHYRAPAQIFRRVVRGMIPHKSERGTVVLARLKCYEGVPPPHDKTKRMVIPDALKLLRKAKSRAEVKLGLVSGCVGWKHSETIKELEINRKERGAKYFYAKKNLTSLRRRDTIKLKE